MDSALSVIQDRIKDTHSRPGQRKDPYVLALVGSAGAMAGSISAAFAARLEAHDLLRIFDFSIASSAGAIVNVYFVCGQAAEGSEMIPTYLSSNGFDNDGRSRRYINWARCIVRRPIWDLDMCVEGLMHHRIPLDIEYLKSAIPTFCLASSEVGEPFIIRIEPNKHLLKEAIYNTCRIPLIIDREIRPGTEKLWDGSFVSSVPTDQAFDLGATHCFVMQNSVHAGRLEDFYFGIYLNLIRRKNPNLARSICKSRRTNLLNAASLRSDSRVFCLSPKQYIGPFEQNQKRIWRAMLDAYVHAGNELGLPDVDYPRLWRIALQKLLA